MYGSPIIIEKQEIKVSDLKLVLDILLKILLSKYLEGKPLARCQW